jgi:hypothetical protein
VSFRITYPPSSSDANEDRWRLEVYDALNQLPNISVRSLVSSPNSSNITANTGDLLVDIGSAASARLFQNLSGVTTGWHPIGEVPAASFPVTSVFGRTGAVIAAIGDYTFAQIASTPTTVAGYGITDAYTKTEVYTQGEVDALIAAINEYTQWVLKGPGADAGVNITDGLDVIFTGSGQATVTRTSRTININVPTGTPYSGWEIVKDGDASGDTVGDGEQVRIQGGANVTITRNAARDFTFAAATGANTLAELTDTAIGTLFDEQILMYVGGSWANVNQTELAIEGYQITSAISATAHGTQGGGTLHAAASTTVAGFMSAADKTKLNNVAAFADQYTAWNLLADSGAGAGIPITSDFNLTITTATGALGTSYSAGTLTISVPAVVTTLAGLSDTTITTPADDQILMRVAGSWANVAQSSLAIAGSQITSAISATAHGTQGGGSLHAVATTSVHGFMSSTDKTKLNNVAAFADQYANWNLHATTGTGAGIPISSDFNLSIVGSGAASTSYSAGTLTINVPAAAAYHWYAGADSGTNRQVDSGDPVTITGGTAVTTAVSDGAPGHQVQIDLTFGTGAGTVAAGDHTHAHFTATNNPHSVTAAQVGAPTTTGGGASGTWGIAITGNAATATALATARTINGTSFNGTANITTANWGTARTLTIGATGKSVNGSGAVSWTLGEIGAAAASHTHAGHDVTVLGNRLTVDSDGKVRANNTGYRRAGMYGVYDSYKIGHVWSIGSAYAIPDDGSNFGTLYGIAYKHTNNATGGAMAGGHQIVFASSGTPGAAIGLAGNIWTSGVIYEAGALLSTRYLGISAEAASAADAAKLGGYSPSLTNVASTVAVRNTSGDILARLFRSEYTSLTTTPNFIMTQHVAGTTGDNYLRPASLSQVKSSMGLANVADSTPTSWGSVTMSGTTGGYAGIRFSGVSRWLMVSASIQGFHNGSAWQWYFNNGSLTVGSVPPTLIPSGTFPGHYRVNGGLAVGPYAAPDASAGRLTVAGAAGEVSFGDRAQANSTTNRAIIYNNAGILRFWYGEDRFTISSSGLATFAGQVNMQDPRKTSARWLKEHIEDLTGSVERIERLRPKSFQWRATGKPAIGAIADEAAAVDPRYGDNESIAVDAITFDLVAAVQELTRRVAMLEAA